MPNAQSLKDLIQDVYISPIRSVLIVDDKFPTTEALLKGDEFEDRHKSLLKSMIDAFRISPRHWLIDIHNGSGSADSQEYKRLHQSDLMILDYHLEDEALGGRKAIEIIKSLALNNYFNIVVVFTACENPEDEIPERVHDIVQALTFRGDVNVDDPVVVPDELFAWSEADEQVKEKLFEKFNLSGFLSALNNPSAALIDNTYLSELAGMVAERSGVARANISKPIYDWLVATKKKEKFATLADFDFGKIHFCPEMINWIKTEKLFITVLPKTTDPKAICDMLLQAIEKSSPSPHQLIMAKIRNTLDESGIKAETKVLEKRHLQAFWLKQMLSANEHERHWKIRQTISHHWEELSTSILRTVQDYAHQLFSFLPIAENDDIKKIVSSYTQIDISNHAQFGKVVEEWNKHVCSKDIDRAHLFTGHIFYLTKCGSNKRVDDKYWICLSPACDLVPNQKQSWGGVETSDIKLIPFKAVMLHKRNINNSLKEATASECVFLKLSNGEIEAFSYAEKSNASPIWIQYFANENGYIIDGKLKVSAIEIINEASGLSLNTTEYDAHLVSQLRYEYALHWVYKLGGTFTRIGLGFVDHRP